jgi:hypothetical protein
MFHSDPAGARHGRSSLPLLLNDVFMHARTNPPGLNEVFPPILFSFAMPVRPRVFPLPAILRPERPCANSRLELPSRRAHPSLVNR